MTEEPFARLRESLRDIENGGHPDEQTARQAGTIQRFRAAVRLLGNEDITPAGRRVLEKILDAEETAL